MPFISTSDGPAEPMDWQPVPGGDWEVRRTAAGYRAELYDRATLLATVTARTRLGLAARTWWARRRA